jgi:hypothetical protein
MEGSMFGPASPIDTATGDFASLRAVARARDAVARLQTGALLATLALLAALAVSLLPRAGGASHSARAPAPHLARGQRGLELLPAAARVPVSSAVGAGERAFRVSRAAGGAFRANTGPLSAKFDRLGVSARVSGARLQLRPVMLSAGRLREALAPVAPRAHANEVDYAYPSLRAWYRNGPAGIEQGFVLARTPLLNASRHSAGLAGPSLDLLFEIHTNARYSTASGGQSVTFTRTGAPVLSLDSLAVTDARGRQLPSGFALAAGKLRLHVDITGAHFPITIDPLLQQGTRLTGSSGPEPEEIGQGWFGLSAAVSEDGTTALVGAPRDNSNAGAVWVFVRSGATWTQQGPRLLAGGPAESAGCTEEPILSGSEESECGFGTSVALSADGNVAIVGSPRDSGHKGGVWVFTRTGNTWSRESRELTGTGEIGEGHFGKAVALSADGTILLASAPSDDKGHGAVWSFRHTSSGWVPVGEGKITPSDENGVGYFGRGLALSPDGSTAVIGGPGDSSYRGAAWLFIRSPAGWTEQTRVTGAEALGASRFGFEVAVSEGAETVLIGGPRDSGDVGSVWVFGRTGSTLTQEGPKLTGPGEVGEGMFGRTIALAASGRIALIGAPRDGSGYGAAWVFTHSLAGWSSQKFSADDSRGQFGASIALSADGNVPIFGEPLSEHKSGVAWAGLPPADVTGIAPASGPADGGTNVTITGAGFTEVTGVYFGTRPAIYEVRSSSSIIALSPSGAGGSTVDVTVVTAHGTSEATAADRFTYGPAEGGGGSEGGGSGGGSSSGGGGEEGPESESEEGSGTLALSASRTPGCHFALLSSRVLVSHGRAAPRLRRVGRGRCVGRLTFSVRVKGKHGRLQARSIGSTRFVISGSSPVTVRVSLNAFGRSLLRGGHGQIRATLLAVRLSPLPASPQAAYVRLRLGH